MLNKQSIVTHLKPEDMTVRDETEDESVLTEDESVLTEDGNIFGSILEEETVKRGN